MTIDELDGRGVRIDRAGGAQLAAGSAEIEAVHTAIAIRRTYLAPVFV